MKHTINTLNNFFLFAIIILICCPLEANATWMPDPTFTGVVRSGQTIAEALNIPSGYTINSTTISVVTVPNGAMSVILTVDVTFDPPPINSYRDMNTGVIVGIPPGSTVVRDPIGAPPPPPGKAPFIIREPARTINYPDGSSVTLPPMNIRPPAGAQVNIGGNIIAQDSNPPGNPSGIFQEIDNYLANLNLQVTNIGASDIPLSFSSYPLSLDTSATAQSLVNSILDSEGISNHQDYFVSVLSFADDQGHKSDIYTYAQMVSEPTTLSLMIQAGLLFGFVHAKKQRNRGQRQG